MYKRIPYLLPLKNLGRGAAMRNFIALFFAIASGVSFPAHATLLGSDIRLEIFYPRRGNPIGDPAVRRVNPFMVEFPNVSLFDKPGDNIGVVPIAIDLDASSITLDFRNTFTSSFLAAPGVNGFNGYVFTDVNDTVRSFTRFFIDPAVTNLAGLTQDRLTFTDNQLFINVSGLGFNRQSFALLDIEFAPPLPRLRRGLTPVSVPEPGSGSLIILGLSVLGWYFWPRKRRI